MSQGLWGCPTAPHRAIFVLRDTVGSVSTLASHGQVDSEADWVGETDKKVFLECRGMPGAVQDSRHVQFSLS